ncbi:MAG: hypothetical protein P0S95_07950 [Rhabdochlamydiaceae bacterium]|nr:hypothetical protein [Candidatus Amphrikana amoebophyrae]
MVTPVGNSPIMPDPHSPSQAGYYQQLPNAPIQVKDFVDMMNETVKAFNTGDQGSAAYNISDMMLKNVDNLNLPTNEATTITTQLTTLLSQLDNSKPATAQEVDSAFTAIYNILSAK